MNLARLLQGTLEVIPLTKLRWKTRRIRLEGKRAVRNLNTVTYRALSSSAASHVYITHAMFSGKDIGEEEKPKKGSDLRIRCNCPAHRFYFANANLQAGAFYGKPDKWAKVPSKRNNVRHIPGLCKHVVALMYVLLQNGEIDTKGGMF